MKIIITENRLEQIAINWLNKNYGNLEPFETETRPYFISYKKGNRDVFEYHKKSCEVWVSYIEIWSFFESYFGMEHEQIRNIMELWIEEHYNLKVAFVDYQYL
jgi:hypothetical protein